MLCDIYTVRTDSKHRLRNKNDIKRIVYGLADSISGIIGYIRTRYNLGNDIKNCTAGKRISIKLPVQTGIWSGNNDMDYANDDKRNNGLFFGKRKYILDFYINT